jgi:hypothetical protein
MESDQKASTMLSARRRACCPVLVLLIVAWVLFFPFHTTVVPAWEVQVVDPNGRPIQWAIGRQVWMDATFEVEIHEGSYITGPDGRLPFPRRRVRASVVERLVGVVRTQRLREPTWGRMSDVAVWKPGWSDGVVSYDPPDSLPTRVVLRCVRPSEAREDDRLCTAAGGAEPTHGIDQEGAVR